jgi:large subunit ribosomal protein L27
MAHKKAQWSTSNGRDSQAKRLGVKIYGWQKIIPGNIIIRQKGNNFWPSEWVSQGHDFTLFATKEWTVRFFQKKNKKYDGRVYVNTFVTVE